VGGAPQAHRHAVGLHMVEGGQNPLSQRLSLP
jgi:hypothetical protein